jgi:O-antigen/teichoic acid export membrane protein
MITVHFSLTGLVGMITKPYWPALMDAFERRDLPWIVRSSNRLRLGGLSFALFAASGLIALGPWGLPLWAGEEFHTSVPEAFLMDRLALIAFAAYFVVHIWRHINQTLALGVGRVSPVARVVVAEALVLVSAASFVLYHEGGIGTIYLSMAASIALLSGWLFPFFFHRGRGGARHLAGQEESECIPPGNLPHERISFKRSAETPPAAELRNEGIPR